MIPIRLGHCAFAALAIAALTLPSVSASAQTSAKITWTVKDIDKASTDISTKGRLCIAANLGPEQCAKVVGGVHFQADRSYYNRKILVRSGPVVAQQNFRHVFKSGGFTLSMPYNRYAPNLSFGHTAEPDYNFILKDGRHRNNQATVSAIKCFIEGLIPGNQYQIQIFWGTRNSAGTTEWDDGVGGRVGKGGILLKPSGPHMGQVATGTFTAHSSGRQEFTDHQDTAANIFAHCNAIQIRDITARPLRARATYYGLGTPGTQLGQRNPGHHGGSNCAPLITIEGHPKVNGTVKLKVENSQDVASAAVFIFGFQPANINVLGGTLLVTPSVVVPLAMPQPPSPYLFEGEREFGAGALGEGHELVLTWPMPSSPKTPWYFQFAQLDPQGPGGLSWTAGIKFEVGL